MILKQTKDSVIELHEFHSEFYQDQCRQQCISENMEILFDGKPSEVKESQAKEWVEEKYDRYRDYKVSYKTYPFRYLLNSFKSACTKDWIIITKKKI